MKILPKIANQAQEYGLKAVKNTKRYINKTTINGRYNRHMDGAAWTGLAGLIHLFNIGSCNPANLGVTACLFATAYINTAAAFIDKIKLRPIKKRAKAINKVAKLAKKKANIQKKINNTDNATLSKPKMLLQSMKGKLFRTNK